MIEKLNEENIFLYAAKHYYNPTFTDEEEFFEDLNRFKYIKRLANRYIESDILAYRLLLNHIIIIFNVFGTEPALNMLEYRLSESHWKVIKPFLLFLNYIKIDQYDNIPIDKKIVEILKTI